MKIKAIRFANGVRCGKGSIEETFIDTEANFVTANKSKYTLEMDEATKEVTIVNLDTGKTIIVFPTNIAYYEPYIGKNESTTKRTSKTITQ